MSTYVVTVCTDELIWREHCAHRYVTSFDTGNQPVTDIFHFIVYDAENNRLDNQMCTITITSVQRQPPVVTVRSGIKVSVLFVWLHALLSEMLWNQGDTFHFSAFSGPGGRPSPAFSQSHRRIWPWHIPKGSACLADQSSKVWLYWEYKTRWVLSASSLPQRACSY